MRGGPALAHPDNDYWSYLGNVQRFHLYNWNARLYAAFDELLNTRALGSRAFYPESHRFQWNACCLPVRISFVGNPEDYVSPGGIGECRNVT